MKSYVTNAILGNNRILLVPANALSEVLIIGNDEL